MSAYILSLAQRTDHLTVRYATNGSSYATPAENILGSVNDPTAFPRKSLTTGRSIYLIPDDVLSVLLVTHSRISVRRPLCAQRFVVRISCKWADGRYGQFNYMVVD